MYAFAPLRPWGKNGVERESSLEWTEVERWDADVGLGGWRWGASRYLVVVVVWKTFGGFAPERRSIARLRTAGLTH